MAILTETESRYVRALGLMSGLTLALFFFRLIATQTGRYLFVPGNLILAWLALVFGWLLARHMQQSRKLGWGAVVWALLWLVFLPNAWYVLSDFIHVYPTGEISQLYDIVLVSVLVISGLTLGF